MDRVGILGGTFDPVHLGHLIIAEQTRDYIGLDKIIFVPNGNPPHKQMVRFTDKYHRLAMLKLATADNPGFEISELEINKTELSYTFDTITVLKQLNGNEIYFIIGADSLINIKTWHRYEELLQLCNFVVFPRILDTVAHNLENWSVEKLQIWISENLSVDSSKFIFIDFPMLEISSTLIRKKVKEKRSLKYLLPDNVIEYICEKKLY